jgi:essential nuclear protein 1
VLLPRIRRDIARNKRLNFHLYQSVKKCMYRPAAFFKGLLLPLAEFGCTPREAVVMSSLLSKCSIPLLHSAVALMKMAQLQYSGTTTLFIKTLLNKKYNLPYRVVDAMVNYFERFIQDQRKMPVVWHQNLLAFIQRYKHSLTLRQKGVIRDLLKYQPHHTITNEVRRELFAPPSVNDKVRPSESGGAQNATSMVLSNTFASASSSSASAASSSMDTSSSSGATPFSGFKVLQN